MVNSPKISNGVKLIIYTDGGAEINPGPAAIGVVICNERNETLKEYSEAIGTHTNNEAEYQALIFALKKAKLLFGKKNVSQMQVECRLDSELVVKHLNHQYKIKEEKLKPLFLELWNLILDFGKVEFTHIPREKNKKADKLVNQALKVNESRLAI